MSTELISSANDILSVHSALISRIRQSQRTHRRLLQNLHSDASELNDLINLPFIPSPPRSPSPSHSNSSPPISPTEPRADRNRQRQDRADLPPSKRARSAHYKNYVPEEETIRNDYSQHYVDSGEWPQNYVLGAEVEKRFEEYPKQHRLLTLKKTAVRSHSLQPTYLPFSEISSILTSSTLPSCKFDVILLDPPFSSSFTWDTLQSLPIPQLAADPSFIFLWVGSGTCDGLERGRDILGKWGYRRCEDVVWVRTNKGRADHGPGTDPPTTSLLVRTKQHCLIGIRGTVRRSTDSWFVHCNVDTDVILWEGDPTDPTLKPPEMYTLIENFCLGTRRLELFGRATSSLRRGWVTVLSEVEEEELKALQHQQPSDSYSTPEIDIHTDSNTPIKYFVPGEEGGELTPFIRETWETGIKSLANGGKPVVPLTSDIDALRPKSPFRPGSTTASASTPGPGSVVGTPGGSSGGNVQMGMNMNNQGPIAPRFNNVNRGGVPNQLMMGMGQVQPFGLGMGMNGMNMNMGNIGGMNPMEAMMAGWAGMGGMNMNMNMNMGNMGGMGVPGGMVPGMQMLQNGMQMGGQFDWDGTDISGNMGQWGR
ncbi:hypothetical protein E1B28_013538 [Marasmius oreades]|uniref:MT-A70-domain-containing protein n=1 Tax=Marasmius oreades TaxID=181124 RepID=A0A9P7RPR1_9AGAR|nr:uncharacterized protein E1B28_013538 [Marasmius oreades]KAG7087584.1 hypothetical protein E1B28_013538 [Marasmius oreades]